MTTKVAQIRGQLTEVVGAMDLDVISGADAAALVREYSRIEKIAASARTLAAARVADTSAWVGEGDRSAEDWLSRQTGTSVGAAARDLRTGRRVKDQPKTRAAMKGGSLSPEQAGAIAEAVEADPAAETSLIETAARETYKHLQDKARRTKAAATDDAERAKRHHRERSAHTSTDADGAFCLSLRGPAGDGARILALLKPIQEEAFRAGRSAAADAVHRDTYDNRTYDAVLALLLGTAAAAPTATPTASAAAPATTSNGTTVAAPASTTATTDHHPGSAPGHDPTDVPVPDPVKPSLFDPGAAATGAGVGAMGASGQGANADLVPGVGTPPPHSPRGDNRPPGAWPSGGRTDPTTGRSPSPASHRSPTDPPGTGPPERRPPEGVHAPPVQQPIRLPGGNNTKVIVRVDHAALLRGHTLAGETSEIAGLGPVPASVVREMLDDAFLAVVVRKGRDVVSVAHHGRGLNVHQRTAIEAQGLRCSNMACNQSVGIQVDHRHPWVKDQVTKLDNQDPLCGPCHRRKTHEGWHLEPGTGPRRFLPPARAG